MTESHDTAAGKGPGAVAADSAEKAEVVRLVRADELKKLLELYRHLNPVDPDISAKEGTKILWNDILQDPRQSIFVVEKDGALIASCTLIIVSNLTRRGKPYALIENVVTHSYYRKMGYGRAVLEKAIEAAREKVSTR